MSAQRELQIIQTDYGILWTLKNWPVNKIFDKHIDLINKEESD